MNPECFDDESVLRSVLLNELDEHSQVLFKQLCMLNYGIQLVRFLVENKHTLATIEGITYHLNESVESDVQELEKLGLVRQVNVADLALFGVTMDSNRRQLMRDLCASRDSGGALRPGRDRQRHCPADQRAAGTPGGWRH